MIMCVTGMPGSGKSTAASFLKSRGFKVIEANSTIHASMKRAGLQINARSQEAFALQMKRMHGKDIFAKQTAKNLLGIKSDIAIIGTRSIEEFKSINSVLGASAILVAIVAPRKLRYKRLSKRKDLPTKDYASFTVREKSNTKMGTKRLLEHADFVVSNGGTVRQFKSSLAEMLKTARALYQDKIHREISASVKYELP